jgi:hypothetical protein
VALAVNFQIARVNIALPLEPLDAPLLAEFVELLDLSQYGPMPYAFTFSKRFASDNVEASDEPDDLAWSRVVCGFRALQVLLRKFVGRVTLVGT